MPPHRQSQPRSAKIARQMTDKTESGVRFACLHSRITRAYISTVRTLSAQIGKGVNRAMRAEILFPHKSVASLAGVRNGKWRELVKRVASLPEDHPDSLAFSMLMIKQCGCLDCNPDRYKALMGCSACAKRTLGGYKGPDEGLVRAFQKARSEVDDYLRDRTLRAA